VLPCSLQTLLRTGDFIATQSLPIIGVGIDSSLPQFFCGGLGGRWEKIWVNRYPQIRLAPLTEIQSWANFNLPTPQRIGFVPPRKYDLIAIDQIFHLHCPKYPARRQTHAIQSVIGMGLSLVILRRKLGKSYSAIYTSPH
jgi:hypothetical protein